MKPLPPVLIVADRGSFLAYRVGQNDHLEKITSAEFEEGNLKLSELVTDQAGAFSTMSQPGSSAAEHLPLEEELQMRCLRQIADLIPQTLDRENAPTWGLAASREINRAILNLLNDSDKDRLAINVQLNLVNQKSQDVSKKFVDAPRWNASLS